MLHRDARAIAWRIHEDKQKRDIDFDLMVAITRGGLVPAALVARELGLRRIETLGVSSYHDYKTQGELSILKEASKLLIDLEVAKGNKVLILDDLTDTGKTAQLVRSIIPDCYYATIYAKPQGVKFVDAFVTEVSQDTWIYFPWDMGYTYQKPLVDETQISLPRIAAARSG
jgi:xanthine phosphoribosyltransferase